MASYEFWHLYVDFGTGWVDITSYVDSLRAPVTARVGDSKETSDQPGTCSFTLANTGHRFTPGNATSNMALATGMPVRVSEELGLFVFVLHEGTVEFPELDDWAADTADQQIAVTSVDQLSRWERSPTFISTLAAYVQHRGPGTSFVGYWPLGEPDGVSFRSVVGSIGDLSRYVVSGVGLTDAQFTPGNAVVAPADDLSVLHMTKTATTEAPVRLRTPTIAVDLPAGQVVTVVVWVRVEATTLTAMNPVTLMLSETGPTASGSVTITYNLAGGFIVASLAGTALSGSTPSTPVGTTEQYVPLALRYGTTPNTLELWARNAVYAATVTGSAPTTSTITEIRIGDNHNGLIGHVQLYLGAATDYTNADFVAQYRMGYEGLERQSTGARISTILQYAGLLPAQLGAVDTGSTLMQAARLAGRTIADPLYEARDTEQGRLFMAGNVPTFHDRRRVYNV